MCYNVDMEKIEDKSDNKAQLKANFLRRMGTNSVGVEVV
jgi:hypothetical protein